SVGARRAVARALPAAGRRPLRPPPRGRVRAARRDAARPVAGTGDGPRRARLGRAACVEPRNARPLRTTRARCGAGTGVRRSVIRSSAAVTRGAAASLPPVPILRIPEPYDFELSLERFFYWGLDRANVWHEGALHRVVGGREVRIERASGGVRVEPLDDSIEPGVPKLL